MNANELLAALLEATEHWENDPRHGRWDGSFSSFVNADGLKPPLLGPATEGRVRPALIDDLADRGLVRLRQPKAGTGIERTFALTDEGRGQARAATPSASGGDAVDLSWPILAVRLRRFVADYEHAGAPQRGLPFDDRGTNAPQLRHLLSAGYLERTEFNYEQLA